MRIFRTTLQIEVQIEKMRLLLSLGLSLLLSCHAFTLDGPVKISSLKKSSITTSSQSKQAVMRIRGGDSALNAGSDYSDAAQALFGNMIGPASMLAGGLVPISFLAPPLPDDTRLKKKIKCLYSIISVLSLSSELLCIIYATIASNKLVETAAAAMPAKSVFELIQRDYELSWIATNVHFIAGLFGFLSLVCIRAYTIFPKRLNVAAAGAAFSSLLGMCSVVNYGISRGDGAGHTYGRSVISLNVRYGSLLIKQLREKGGVLTVLAIGLGLVSAVLGVRALLSPEEEPSKSE